MPSLSASELRSLVSASPLFESLDPEELDAVGRLARTRRVRSGQVVFCKGDPSDRLFAVLCGRAKAVATAPDGRELVLRIFEPGAIFGEIGLLDGMERTATVVIGGDGELLSLARSDFLALLRRRPEIAIKLLAVLAGRLRSTTQQTEDNAFLRLPPRLAKKLLELASGGGRREPEGSVTLRLSQEELGTLVKGSRVSVNRELRAFEAAGLLRLQRGAITIRDPDGLRRVVAAIC